MRILSSFLKIPVATAFCAVATPFAGPLMMLNGKLKSKFSKSSKSGDNDNSFNTGAGFTSAMVGLTFLKVVCSSTNTFDGVAYDYLTVTAAVGGFFSFIGSAQDFYRETWGANENDDYGSFMAEYENNSL